MNQRLLVSAAIVTALVTLGCAGMGGDPSPTPGARGDTSKLKVGASSFQRGAAALAAPGEERTRRAHKKDQYLVKLAPGVARLEFKNGALASGNSKLDGAMGQLGAGESRKVHRDEAKNRGAADKLGLGRTVRFRSTKPMEEVIAKLEANPDVEWVEAVTEMHQDGPRGGGGDQDGGGRGGKAGKAAKANGAGGGNRAAGAGAPNDPYYPYQWHLQNLDVPEAWKISQGEGVVVAVVDTGVSANEDGFFKLLPGKDFVDGDDDPEDLNGHGSHVAGTIGQASNNGIGTAGVAPRVSILPVRVLDANGSGDNTSVAEGIIWAVDHGANIINLSLGSPANSETVADAVAYAYENNVTVVAATGNDGFTDFIGFPAALPTPIAVGSVDLSSNVAFYSNQGREIDVVGPGGDTSVDANGDAMMDGVLQETRMEGVWSYYFLQGTSMATPHVAGVAALVYANGVRDPDALRQVLQNSATDLGGNGWDKVYGYGMVNPVAALNMRGPRNSNGGGGGGADVAFTGEPRVRRTGGSRTVISWTTNVPSMSVVKGPGGFERKDSTLSRVHQVAVTGTRGDTVEFTVGAATSKDDKVKQTVSVTF
jgi:serine protease